MKVFALFDIISKQFLLDTCWNDCDLSEHFIGLSIFCFGGFYLHLTIKFVPVCQKHMDFGIPCLKLLQNARLDISY
jgi:hypothetical protein